MNQELTSTVTHGTWLMLKVTYGLVALIAGVDKFFYFITSWEKYLSPTFASFLPIDSRSFMYLVGLIEIIVGIMILTKFTRLGAYLLAAWLVLIVANLLSIGGYYDIAVRDIVMAIGALALAQLTLIQEQKL